MLPGSYRIPWESLVASSPGTESVFQPCCSLTIITLTSSSMLLFLRTYSNRRSLQCTGRTGQTPWTLEDPAEVTELVQCSTAWRKTTFFLLDPRFDSPVPWNRLSQGGWGVWSPMVGTHPPTGVSHENKPLTRESTVQWQNYVLVLWAGNSTYLVRAAAGRHTSFLKVCESYQNLCQTDGDMIFDLIMQP